MILLRGEERFDEIYSDRRQDSGPTQAYNLGMDIHIASSDPNTTGPDEASSRLAKFGKKISAAAQWLAPSKIAERRRLNALAAIAVKAIHAACDERYRAKYAAEILDNAWQASGADGFACAMGKAAWNKEGRATPPAHAAIAIKDPEWALKLAAMLPDGAWHRHARHDDYWFGELPVLSRQKSSHHPKLISAPLALCANGAHLDQETWQAFCALMARDGVRAPQGDDFVLAQHILDEHGQSAKKASLRSWSESDQLAQAAPEPTSAPPRKTRSL